SIVIRALAYGDCRPRAAPGEGHAHLVSGCCLRVLLPEVSSVDNLVVRAFALSRPNLPARGVARPRDPRPVLRLHSAALSTAWSHGPGDPGRQDPEGPV